MASDWLKNRQKQLKARQSRQNQVYLAISSQEQVRCEAGQSQGSWRVICTCFSSLYNISLCTSTFRQNATSYLVYTLWAMQHGWYSLVNRVRIFFSWYLISQKLSRRSELRQFWEKRMEKAQDRWQWKRDVPKLSFQTIQKRNRLRYARTPAMGNTGKKCLFF